MWEKPSSSYFKPVLDDGFLNKPKHVARFGQQNVLFGHIVRLSVHT